jgi:hypothetical protein
MQNFVVAVVDVVVVEDKKVFACLVEGRKKCLQTKNAS